MSFLRLLWLRRDWRSPSPIDPLEGQGVDWRVIPSDGVSIAASNDQLVATGGALLQGWYLFLIQHRGDNPPVTGWLVAADTACVRGALCFQPSFAFGWCM